MKHINIRTCLKRIQKQNRNISFKIVLYILTLNVTGVIYAQDLYVDNDSYLYARDVVLYVNDDIRLETATSNLYLRGDAQLMQNTDTKNSDEGELSVYRNQTTGIYEYNFFCSPVGISQGGTQANEVFDGSNIHDPTDHTDLTNVGTAPYTYTTDYNGTATELSNYWIYTYINGEGYYSWNQMFDTDDIAPGYGFTLKGSPNLDNILDFRGRPNNGNIDVECIFDGTDDQPGSGTPNTAETLTGNPYPSALDLKLFLTDGFGTISDTGTSNRNVINGEIYFWEQKQKNSHILRDYEAGYGVYAPGDPTDLSDNGSYTPAAFENYDDNGGVIGPTTGTTTDFDANNARRYAAIGQGFVIQSDGTGGTVTFTNGMRLYLPEDSTITGDGSIFAKGKSSKKEDENTKTKVVAMSHNGFNYESSIKTPTIVPDIKIHTKIDNTYYKENLIAFRDGTPNNYQFNKFFDASNANELGSDAYMLSSGKTLSIKSIKYDDTVRIPFGLKTDKDNTPFSLRVHKMDNIPDDVDVFIYDNETGTYTNIKNGVFSIVLNTGVYNDRFEITFNNQNTLNTETITVDDFKIFENVREAQLEIVNPQLLDIENISLIDVSGKKVLSRSIPSTSKKFSINIKSLSSGVYIVNLQLSNNQTLNKKVILSGY